MRIAIVTGASSGMGREFVKQIDALYKELDEIWVISRRIEQLEELKSHTRTRILVLAGDLEKETVLKELEEQLAREKPDVRMLVNAAGFGKAGSVEQIAQEDREIQSRMVNLNCMSLTKIVCLCLPYLSKGSRILNLASASAFCPQCGFSVYAATKSYVLSFSRSLNRELKKRGITVTAVCPGPVRTEFFQTSGRSGGKAKESVMAEPEKVVRYALKDAKNKKEVSVYGTSMKMARVAAKIIPHRILISIMEWMNKIQ